MIDYALTPARLADARRLSSMSQAWIEAGLRPAWSESRISWHIRHPESVVLCARTPAVIVGFGLMRYADDAAHLNLLAVSPTHRRRGVGRQLLNWLEQTALTAGTFVIGLELRAVNEAAFRFYSALGYREQGRVTGYYQGIEHAISMTRDLRSGSDANSGLKQSAP